MHPAIIIAVIATLGHGTRAQFFYSNYPQQVAQYFPHQQPYLQPYQPVQYNGFPHFSHQVRYLNPVQNLVNYNSVGSDTVQIEAAERRAPQPNIKYEEREDNFRGFAYHTQFHDGAHSNVIFVTGPEAQFANQQTRTASSPRSSASDSVDSNAITVESSRSNDESFRTILDFLDNGQQGVQQFYSVNNVLVARRPEDEVAIRTPSFRSLAPPTPINPLFAALRSRFNGNASIEKNDQLSPASSETEELVVEASSPSTSTSTPTSTTTTTTTTKQPSTSQTTTEEAVTKKSSSTMEPIIVEETTKAESTMEKKTE